MFIGLHVKHPLYLLDVHKPSILSTDIPKILKHKNLMKFCPVGSEMFYADEQTDGRTDMRKRIVAFRNFANAL